MKGKQKIKRIHLAINDKDLPAMIGIVSPDPDYKLSLKLNKKLGISLKNITPVIIKSNEGDELHFSRFADNSDVSGSVFQLVSNRAGSEYLLKKLKNIDYLMLINSSGEPVDMEILLSRTREVEWVTGVFKIEFKALRDKNLEYLVG